MKKIYLLALLCAISFVSFAQTTAVIFSSGVAGSYLTGTATSTTRTDGPVTFSSSTALGTRGYAVFDLSTIPSTAVITSCIIGMSVTSINPPGGPAPSGWATYGYPGDLSLVTTPATLYADMVTPVSTLLSNSTYGTTTGAKTIPSAAAAVSLIQSNIGGKVSISFTGGGSKTYTFTGCTGTTATTAASHAPYLQITYTCSGIGTVSAFAAPTSLCDGGTLLLNASAPGATSYGWSGPAGFTSTALNTSRVVTTSSAGVYTFAATNASGCTEKHTTTAVTVNPLPTATITPAGPTAFCLGGNVSLDAPTTTGYSYIWFSGTAPIPGETNASYVANASGSYYVQIGDANGCVKMSAATDVVVLTSASITPSGTLPLCSGGNVTMIANPGGSSSSITYQWQESGLDIAGATSAGYTTTTSGAYNCIVSAGTCTVSTSVTTLILFPLPHPPISLAGSTLVTSSSYVSYQWFLNTVAITGATSSTVPAAANGSYRVRVTDSNGCTNYSTPYNFGALAVQQLTGADVKIYPNPANDLIHIESPEAVKAVISSIVGRELMQVTNAKDINVTALANGVYLLAIYNKQGDRILVQKLVKE